MRDQCTKNPYAEECSRIKTQMEDLLRKCRDMTTPVSACDDVKTKYCYIFPTELYCYSSINVKPDPFYPPYNGGGSDDWTTIPSDSFVLKDRGDYCVTHQAEQKCKNLLSALKQIPKLLSQAQFRSMCHTLRVPFLEARYIVERGACDT
ncbi:unnamed protein product [Didymodactylos carnosus]|nr:unnamed protein product [Didymodactylos carnosus]CAF4388927.1 unnamed protein product [Didymodactylos carnosus]